MKMAQARSRLDVTRQKTALQLDFKLHPPRQFGCNQPVTFREIVLQRSIVHAFAGTALDPRHAARGEIGRRYQPWLLLQQIKAHFGAFEGDEESLPVIPAADGENLAADFPDMRAAPLHDMGRGMERGAESVVFVERHERVLS